jgi:hypothetical protein
MLDFLRRSATSVFAWIADRFGLADDFNAGVYVLFGPERALEFSTGNLR